MSRLQPKAGRVISRGVAVHSATKADAGKLLFLAAPRADDFTLSLTYQDAAAGDTTSVGIASASCQLTKITLKGAPEVGFFLQLCDGNLFGQDGTYDKDSGIEYEAGQRVHVRYCSNPRPTLFCSVDGGEEAVLQFDGGIPLDNYLPCITLCEHSVLDVEVASPEKRSRVATLVKLWEDSCFTDCEVRCCGKTFSAHRAILAVTSPVFAATFGGQMMEATTQRLDIDDASALGAEGLVRFAYTKEIQPGTGIEVLPLAIRYQVEALVEVCSDDIMNTISPSNVVEIMRSIKPVKGDPLGSDLWNRVLAKLDDDQVLRHAALEGL